MITDGDNARRDQLGTELLAFREELLPEIHPAGTAAVRRTVRRRRQVKAVVVTAAAALIVAVPVATYAALDRDPAPVGPRPDLPATSAPTTPPASPTPSAARTDAQAAADERIREADLLAATVDLPAWAETAPATCGTDDVRLRRSSGTPVPVLLDLVYVDVDTDGSAEAVARLICPVEGASPRQVTVFDRDSRGRIVTFGQVVRTGQDGIVEMRAVTAGPGGTVRVRVAGQAMCCDVDPADVPLQWRTYAWTGGRFRQTAGPTEFPPPPTPPAVRLTVSASDMVYGPKDGDGNRRATTTVTIGNPGGATVEFPMITFPENGRDHAAHSDWSGCPTALGRPDRVICVARPLAPGETRTIPFPFVTASDGPPGSATVRVEVGADRDGTAVPDTDAQTTFQVSFPPT
jgi:hypothetical protein